MRSGVATGLVVVGHKSESPGTVDPLRSSSRQFEGRCFAIRHPDPKCAHASAAPAASCARVSITHVVACLRPPACVAVGRGTPKHLHGLSNNPKALYSPPPPLSFRSHHLPLLNPLLLTKAFSAFFRSPTSPISCYPSDTTLCFPRVVQAGASQTHRPDFSVDAGLQNTSRCAISGSGWRIWLRLDVKLCALIDWPSVVEHPAEPPHQRSSPPLSLGRRPSRPPPRCQDARHAPARSAGSRQSSRAFPACAGASRLSCLPHTLVRSALCTAFNADCEPERRWMGPTSSCRHHANFRSPICSAQYSPQRSTPACSTSECLTSSSSHTVPSECEAVLRGG